MCELYIRVYFIQLNTKKVVLEFCLYMNLETFTLTFDYAGKCTMHNININIINQIYGKFCVTTDKNYNAENF